MTDIQSKLFELRDEKYRAFNSNLIPNIDAERVIGVRTPFLRAFAKEIKGSEAADSFVASLPHFYFEENQLHAFILESERDLDKCISHIEAFLPFVDNWATCDQLSPKCFYKTPDPLIPYIEKWLESGHTYKIRFATVCLMRYFLDDRFDIKYAQAVANVKSNEYYVKMAVAWYFATALAKQWGQIIPFIAEKRLDDWTHNKAILKATESQRISDEQKRILKGYKI